jgi:two-component system KDP operon response regulator KdpE
MSARILVVDDEPQFLRALTTNLRGAGYEVETATTAEEALAAAGLQPPVLVSAVGDEEEKIAALDAGADDYVTKPFAAGELLARLRAVLRRAGPPGSPVVEIGGLRVDLDKDEVTVDGRLVHLTPHEYRILSLLARHPGKLLTHRTILREVWGPAYGDESNYLHVYVSQLRRKLGPEYLKTEPGAGYRLVEP